MKLRSRLFTVLVVSALMAGCQKDVNTPTAPAQPGDSNSTEGSLMLGDRTFEGLNTLTDDFMGTSGLKSSALTCPSISVSSITSFPVIITLDWGTGCTNAIDSITRSGKITVSLSGMMNAANSVATFTFNEFVSGGNKITGVHRITYLGLNTGNNWPRYAVFTEAKIEFPDKKFITYRAEYTRLKSEGSATATFDDDVWRIEGHSSGVTREGKSWTASYPSALVKRNSCKWFGSGSVLVTPEGMDPRTINFGDGTCDNKATLTIGEHTYNIEL